MSQSLVTASTVDWSGRYKVSFNCKLYGGSANIRSNDLLGKDLIILRISPLIFLDDKCLKFKPSILFFLRLSVKVVSLDLITLFDWK